MSYLIFWKSDNEVSYVASDPVTSSILSSSVTVTVWHVISEIISHLKIKGHATVTRRRDFDACYVTRTRDIYQGHVSRHKDTCNVTDEGFEADAAPVTLFSVSPHCGLSPINNCHRLHHNNNQAPESRYFNSTTSYSEPHSTQLENNGCWLKFETFQFWSWW